MLTDRRNGWLDVCRALAILMVLLSHGRTFLVGYWPVLDGLKAGGFLGVELFFGLSGLLIGQYLLTSAMNDVSQPNLLHFWRRRWLRTLPVFYLMILVNVGLALSGTRPSELSRAWQFPLLVQNTAWSPPAFFPESWSLSIEETFYLLLPLAAAAIFAIRRRSLVTSLWIAACAVLLASLSYRTWFVFAHNPTWDEGLRKIVVFRLDATIYGLLAGLLWFQHSVRPPKWLSSVGVLALIFVYAYAARSTPASLNASLFARTALFPIVSLSCAAALLIGVDWKVPALIRIPANFIARVSYSAYLLHLPIIAVLQKVWTPSSSQEAVGEWCVFFLIVFTASWLLYRLFERPIMRLAPVRRDVAPAAQEPRGTH